MGEQATRHAVGCEKLCQAVVFILVQNEEARCLFIIYATYKQ